MDVVYPLGTGSQWRNLEILYSIRSLFKHASNQFDKIVIVGEKPRFFEYGERLIHIPFVETQAKEVNIWEKVLTAATDGRISHEFFFMNDDHFFLNDFSMSQFPYFHRGNLKDFSWANKNIGQIKSGYSRKAKRTLDFLEKRGFSTWHYDIHTPKRLEKDKFINTYNYFKSELYKDDGFIMLSSYCNYNAVEPTYKADLKVKRSDVPWLKANYQNELLFSTHAEARCYKLRLLFQELYPEQSPFEK